MPGRSNIETCASRTHELPGIVSLTAGLHTSIQLAYHADR